MNTKQVRFYFCMHRLFLFWLSRKWGISVRFLSSCFLSSWCCSGSWQQRWHVSTYIPFQCVGVNYECFFLWFESNLVRVNNMNLIQKSTLQMHWLISQGPRSAGFLHDWLLFLFLFCSHVICRACSEISSCYLSQSRLHQFANKSRNGILRSVWMREGPVTWCRFGENGLIYFLIVSVIMNTKSKLQSVQLHSTPTLKVAPKRVRNPPVQPNTG